MAVYIKNSDYHNEFFIIGCEVNPGQDQIGLMAVIWDIAVHPVSVEAEW